MFSDLRYAVRQLIKSPGFTIVAVLTLALGIGACTAIFSVVNGVLLRPLDYPEPERLMVLRETQLPDYPEFSVSPLNFLDWEKQATSFASMAAYGGAPLNFTGDAEPQRLIGVRVTGHYFDVYGIKAVIGRTLLPEEDTPGKDRVVFISNPFWQRAFAGDASVLGRSLQLNGEPYTVVGVAPAGFGAASKVDAWVPMAFRPDEVASDTRGAHYISATGRLKPGVTPAQADAELKVIAAQLAKQYPDSNKGWSAFAKPLLEYTVRDVHDVLYTLLGAVGCVLLIACANIANLLLSRASARSREISIRAALGAGRARLIRQLLTESVLLSLLGGGAGILLARWGLDALLALAPANLPRVSSIQLDGTVFAGSMALSVATGLIFGLAPAWLAARTDVNEALKQGTRGSTEGGAQGRLRSALVVLEVAASLVLLAGAGLLARSFVALAHVDPGFNPEHATVMRLTLPAKKYGKPEQRLAFADALIARLTTLPGVQAVGLAQSMPLINDYVLGFNVEGRPRGSDAEMPNTNYYSVTPDYFRAMGVRLMSGRLFTAGDNATAPRVAIINETMAKQVFPHENPIGKRINITQGNDAWREIVGVVSDMRHYGVDHATTNQSYEPFAQVPFTGLNIVIRTEGDPGPLLGTLRPTVYAVDKDQPVGSVRPLEDILSDSISRQRFTMTLLTVFSLVALLIAAVGIYGVMAYNVTQRTSEIGIRMALGAQPADVLRLVFAQGSKLVGLGLVLGLVIAFAGARAVESILFNTSAHDPLTLAGITLLLAAVAALACLLPARRAARVDPIVALRAE